MKKIYQIIATIIFTSATYSKCLALDIELIKQQYIPQLEDSLSRLQGSAVAIIYKNQVIYQKTFGSTRLGGPKITADTLFPLASASKPIMASTIAYLYQNNLINLDGDIAHQLKLNQKGLKLKHLLNHTSGYYFTATEEIEAGTKRATIKKQFQRILPKRKAGSYYLYNNFTFSLLQDVVENATGHNWINSVEQFWQKLGVEKHHVAYCYVTKEMLVASPHLRNKKTNEAKMISFSPKYYPETACASAGFFASITALIEFVRLNLGYYNNILNDETLKLFQTPHASALEPFKWVKNWPVDIRNVEAHYGFGWRMIGLKNDQKHKNSLIFHGGRLNGISSFIGFMPHKEIGIIILANENVNLLQNAVYFWGLTQNLD